MVPDRFSSKFLKTIAVAAFCFGMAAVALANESIEIHIINPKYDAEFRVGEKISFRSNIPKEDANAQNLTLTWTSSLDGRLGTGAAIALDTLSVGVHRITLDVSGKSGVLGADSIKVKVSLAKSGTPGQQEIFDDVTGGGEYIPNPFN